MKTKKFISLSMMLALTAGMFIGLHPNQKSEFALPVEAAVDPVEAYYSDISDNLTGDALKSALNALNNKKRKRTMGYGGHKTYLKYTERTSTTPSNKMVGFYDNALVSADWDNQTTWNREHVWPKSRGGDNVEADIHMVRPASVKINSERGNLFYGSSGSTYDPGQYVPEYRGIAARIIMYCVIADTNLSLVDKDYDSSANKTMGKLSDLLKWNLQYLPTSKTTSTALLVEQNRNEVIFSNSSLQGNRNPFIDHPEYACKIWGNVNATTKSICGSANVNISESSINLVTGKTHTINAVSKDNSQITWTSGSTNIVTISSSTSASGSDVTLTAVNPGSCTITASATIGGTTYSATCSVRVSAPQTDTLSSITLDTTNVKKQFEVGEQFNSDGLVVTAHYTLSGSKIVEDYERTTPDLSTAGTKTVTVKYTDNNVTKTASYDIEVTEQHIASITLNATELTLKPGETFQLVATISPDSAPNKDVVWAPLSHNVAKVSTLGKVTAKAPGTVTVTATTVDGGKVASCVVTVTESGGGGGSSSSGCGGNIATTSIVLSTLSVLGIGLLLIKRKFSK